MGISPEQLRALKSRGFSTVVVGKERNEEATIAYRVSGDGGEQLILLSGLMLRGDHWAQQVKALQRNFQVLVIDNRGVGESSESSVLRYTTRMLAMDAYEVLEHLGWDKYHIVGQSMGGMIAQELALLNLHRVQSIALLATHAGSFRSLPTAACVTTVLRNLVTCDENQQFRNSISLVFGDAFVSDEARCQAFFRNFMEDREKYGDGLQSVVLKQAAAVFTHRIPFGRLQAIKRAEIPALVVAGRDDKLIRPANSIEIASALEIEPILLPRIGHDISNEYTHNLTDLLTKHVNMAGV